MGMMKSDNAVGAFTEGVLAAGSGTGLDVAGSGDADSGVTGSGVPGTGTGACDSTAGSAAYIVVSVARTMTALGIFTVSHLPAV